MTTERFITGIYNYCDYWCERCAFPRDRVDQAVACLLDQAPSLIYSSTSGFSA